ncbi:MAG: hypothetical protein LUF82_03445, partial [Clostridia bacterium]|nr:hypothetical protein [Clostridia bacterium]
TAVSVAANALHYAFAHLATQQQRTVLLQELCCSSRRAVISSGAVGAVEKSPTILRFVFVQRPFNAFYHIIALVKARWLHKKIRQAEAYRI